MKFPIKITYSRCNYPPDWIEEVQRRANAFDELLEFVRITYNCDFGRNINETALNLLTKYETKP